MIAMSSNASASMGSTFPGSFNSGMQNSNCFATGIWQNWQIIPQTQIQSVFSTGIGRLSFHNHGNPCECPICKGPTWASGRVCEHCKTNFSRWRHISLEFFGLNASDLIMLKNKLNELQRLEDKERIQEQNLNLPVSGIANHFVVKGFC